MVNFIDSNIQINSKTPDYLNKDFNREVYDLDVTIQSNEFDLVNGQGHTKVSCYGHTYCGHTFCDCGGTKMNGG